MFQVCLFGAEELNLRDPLRNGEWGGVPHMRAPFDHSFCSSLAGGISSLPALLREAIQRKPAALGGHGDMYGIAGSENRPMILIGG